MSLTFILSHIDILLQDGNVIPDLRSKIVKWFNNHAHLGGFQKSFLQKLKSSILSKPDVEATDSNGVVVSESEIPDPVAVKSVPPRRRTKSSMRISRENNIISSSEEVFCDKRVDQLDGETLLSSSKVSTPDVTGKVSMLQVLIFPRTICCVVFLS